MCKSLNLTHRTSLAGVDTLPTDQGHSGPSAASMRHSRLLVEVKPQGRESGAPPGAGLEVDDQPRNNSDCRPLPIIRTLSVREVSTFTLRAGDASPRKLRPIKNSLDSDHGIYRDQSVDVFALRARGGGRFSDACALRACLRCDLPSKVRGLRIRRRRSGAEVAEPVARMRPRVLRLRDVAGAGASIPMRRRAQDRDGPWRTRSGWDSPR